MRTTLCSEVLWPTGVWSYRQCHRMLWWQPDPLLTRPAGAGYLRVAWPDPGEIYKYSGSALGLDYSHVIGCDSLHPVWTMVWSSHLAHFSLLGLRHMDEDSAANSVGKLLWLLVILWLVASGLELLPTTVSQVASQEQISPLANSVWCLELDPMSKIKKESKNSNLDLGMVAT